MSRVLLLYVSEGKKKGKLLLLAARDAPKSAYVWIYLEKTALRQPSTPIRSRKTPSTLYCRMMSFEQKKVGLNKIGYQRLFVRKEKKDLFQVCGGQFR